MNKMSILDIDLRGKLVFLRNDFNVPLDDQGHITDDTRIREAIPTYRYLIDQECRIVCASHLGRPKGVAVPALSLKPVAARLSEMLQREVRFTGETVGAGIEAEKERLGKGDILMLENLRFHPGETKNDGQFAEALSKKMEVYVDDAFGAAHRAHASIEGITRHCPVSVTGLLLKKEIEQLSAALRDPPKEYVLILGGAKVSDKIPLIENLMGKAKTILIGGAMAYTFLKSKGEEVGNSKVENDFLSGCKEILETAEQKGVKILLPHDHIAAFSAEPQITLKITRQGETIPPEMMGLDIGPETIESFSAEIKQAKLIVWNGPMGVFEVETFSGGTIEIARAIAGSNALTIVGGGDTIAALKKAGVLDKISHVSTGGGASLEFLSGMNMPGIEALNDK